MSTHQECLDYIIAQIKLRDDYKDLSYLIEMGNSIAGMYPANFVYDHLFPALSTGKLNDNYKAEYTFRKLIGSCDVNAIVEQIESLKGANYWWLCKLEQLLDEDYTDRVRGNEQKKIQKIIEYTSKLQNWKNFDQVQQINKFFGIPIIPAAPNPPALGNSINLPAVQISINLPVTE